MARGRKPVIAALTMGVLATLGGLRAADLYWRRAEIIRASTLRADNLVSILSEYVSGTFRADDAALRQLSLQNQRVGGPGAPDADWAPSLAAAKAGLPSAGSISIVDAEGVIRHSTQTSVVGQSTRDQDLFQRLSTDPGDAFLVGAPYLTASEPKQSLIPVGRRLTTPTGAFDGIAAIAFAPAALGSVFRRIGVEGAGAVWVLHPGGFVLFREPPSANPLGEPPFTNPILRAARGSTAGLLEGVVTPNGPVMLSAFRVTDAPPLVVAVTLDRRKLLADWRRQLVAWSIGFLVLMATMAATLTALFRQMDAKDAVEQDLVRAQLAESQHLKAANERLEGALQIEWGARRETEAAARLKDEFVMTVSHELRTPLTAITGWVQILETGKLSTEQTSAAIETIGRSARVQARLVDDLLDVSRMIGGTLRLDVREVNLADVLLQALAIVRPAADAKSISLDTEIEPGLGSIMADPDRLQQIVWNLLSNAIKFTPAGGRVMVRAERRGPSIDLAITDSGVGISPEFLPHVFDRFRQGDAGTQRRHSGLGLGLAIARHLVELHGGTITVESAGEGHGAVFRVSLHRRTSAAQMAAQD